jgi:cytidine deaminase
MYLENAAYNPSLPPLQAALTGLVANSVAFSDITEAVLLEKSQAKVTLRCFSLSSLSLSHTHTTTFTDISS